MSTALASNQDPQPTEAGATPVASGRQLGRYEILCELASGGMASVHIARAQGVAGFERLVAIKVLHPHLAHEEEFISMFLDEARLAARIRHPNVVGTQDISDTDGNGYFLVMDYVEGDHLGALLGKSARSGTAFPTPITARILIDALNGLAAAHELVDEAGAPLNIVHRDLSPHNILIGTEGVARVTDFGVAKAEVRLSCTRAGQFKGKLAYMAPEQASTGACDQRSDLFAMGIILWESLTARRLFRGESNAATLSKILVDPIPPPSAVNAALEPWDALLARALARAPDERFQSADEFAQAIEDVAMANGGVATSRTLGALTKELIGAKVELERERIHAAIVGNNVASGTQPRIPIPTSMTGAAIPGVATHARIMAGTLPISGEMTGQVMVIQGTSNRTSLLLVTALVLVAFAAAAAGYFANRTQATTVQHVIVPAPTSLPSTPVAPTGEARAASPSSASAATAASPSTNPTTVHEAIPRGASSVATAELVTRSGGHGRGAHRRPVGSNSTSGATAPSGATATSAGAATTQAAPITTPPTSASDSSSHLIETNPYRQ